MPDGLVRRDDAVLVVIDIQERLAATMPDRELVVPVARRLMRVAALLGWPTILTRQYPSGLGGLVPEIASLAEELSAEDVRIRTVDKETFSCAAEPAFMAELTAIGRHQVVLVGMETHICVSQTALALLTEGHEVFLAADACCSMQRLDHEVALERMRSAGVVVTTSQPVMYEAVGRAATDEFRALLAIVKGE